MCNFSKNTKIFASKNLMPINESTAYNCRKLQLNGLIHGCFSKDGIIRIKIKERAKPVKIFCICISFTTSFLTLVLVTEMSMMTSFQMLLKYQMIQLIQLFVSLYKFLDIIVPTCCIFMPENIRKSHIFLMVPGVWECKIGSRWVDRYYCDSMLN